MAQVPVTQTTKESKTDGKSFGPVSHNQLLVGALIILITFICGSLGLVIPAEVAQAATYVILIAVAWLTKGRVCRVETRVEVPTPTVTPDPIADGTGAHRASVPAETTTL